MQQLNIFALIDVAKSMEQRMSVALFYSGLRIPQFRALDFIDKQETATVTDLSRRFGTTRATASTLANDLIRSDALIAVENVDDRRSFFLKLTQSGKNRLSVGRKDLQLVLDSISETYPEDVVQQLNQFFRAPGD
jgi:DNA-binding MarR family transcriptional regulator